MGAQTSNAILRRVLGDQLTVLDTGCCGMAARLHLPAIATTCR